MIVKKKNNKKGFTLVEVIVVLVVLAILAAILIPSMIGYINKAEGKAAILEGRAVMLAAQIVASENNDRADSALDKAITGAHTHNGEQQLAGSLHGAVLRLAEVSDSANISDITFKGGKIIEMKYRTEDGRLVKYTAAKGLELDKPKE